MRMIIQDTLQVSLAEHKIREEQEARENVKLVKKHLVSKEVEKMVEGSENVIDDSLPPRNDEPQIPSTRLEPRSDKESPKVEKTNVEEVEVTNVVIPVNVNEEEDEITNELYELKRREKGKIVKESRSTPLPTLIRSPRTHTNPVSSNIKKLQELTTKEELERMIAKAILQESGNIQAEISSQIQKAIDNQIPSQVDASMKFENLQVQQTTCRPSAVHPSDQDDPHDDAHLEGENSNQEQEDDYDFWTDSYASDDEEIQPKQVLQDIMEEVSLTIDEAKLKKMADEICQRDPEAPTLSLINQDLLYLKKGSPGPEKIVLSLHKFSAIIFNEDDIEERTSRWNPYAKIFYIRKQKEPGKPKEEIVTRRANECIVSITELDYNNHNKNDIEDMYLLIMNGKVPDYAKIGLLWTLSVFIRSSVIWERVHDFQVLEGLKSYNNDVKYGYVQRELTNDEVEYLKLFEEEIEV
ncbi:hypothetical protein Tco_0905993, partial [Tanacetum coccineum]